MAIGALGRMPGAVTGPFQEEGPVSSTWAALTRSTAQGKPPGHGVSQPAPWPCRLRKPLLMESRAELSPAAGRSRCILSFVCEI